MAGDSEKKRAAKEAFARSLWVNAIKIINFLYISIRIFWKWESFTLSVMFGFAVITGLTYTCWNFISGALKTGSPYDYWEDLLCINLVVQCTSIYSGAFYWLYLIVPIFVVIKWWSVIAGYLGFKIEEKPVPEYEFDRKRREKFERQAARQERLFGNRR